MQGNPLVTVLITAYNNPDYLNEAVQSAINQDYPKLEVLVVDDGSKPRLQESIEQINNPTIKYRYMEHKGFPHGLIRGVEEAKGEYIAILDHDDILTEGSISKRVDVLERNKDLGLVYGDINYINGNSQIYSSQCFKDYSSLDSFIEAMLASLIGPLKHSGIMFRKKSIVDVGNYDPTLQSDFDNDLVIRIARKHRWEHLNEIVVNYRTHENNAISVLNLRMKGLKDRFMLVDRYVNDPSKKIQLKAKVSAINIAKAVYETFSFKKPQWVINMFGGGNIRQVS